MSCLCQKLLTRKYSQVNEREAELLRRTWEEASYLFQATLPTPPNTEEPKRKKRLVSGALSRVRNHPRTLSSSCSSSPIRDGFRHRSSQATLTLPPSSTATATTTDLEKTYSCKIAEGSGQLSLQQESHPSGYFVRIFLALERIDQKIEIQQLSKRVYCYAFAQLHNKFASVDQIVQEVQDALPDTQNTRRKVYHFLHIGTKWVAILERFATISSVARQQLTGLLCLLQSGSSWERASLEDCGLALANLYKNTDIFKRTTEFTPVVNRIVNEIALERSFLDETPKFTSHPQLTLNAISMSQDSRSSLVLSLPGFWKSPSLNAASKTLPRPSNTHSEDANILLVLLCFLATREKIPVNLLFRGAKPQKRWNVHGQVEEMDAICAGLDSELGRLLSDIPRLSSAFNELDLSSVVSKHSDQTYTVDEAVVGRIRKGLSPELHAFWRCQALILAYRSIPWKYIEPSISNVRELFFPHLKHTLQAYRDGFEQLPAITRADLVLSLVEASRFPKIEWKRFAIAQANLAVIGVMDQYLRSRIAESESLLYRITGDMNRSVDALRNPRPNGPLNTTDKRMHSAIGQIAVQRSLNGIQAEDLAMAEQSLEGWKPLGQSTSPMEDVVLFRKDMILGRILRFGGRFKESLAHLERSRNLANQHRDLNFDEDLRDLTCDLSDTLRELEDPVSAERHVRTEIARRDQTCTIFPGRTALELSLAEALFAQGRSEEAEKLCLDVQSRDGLLKFEKLRLYITLAKLRQVDSDDEGAFSHWANALVAISKFPIETGGTTRIILMSICDILDRQGRQQLLNQSLQQLDSMEKLARPGRVWYWIAGLRHWQEFLDFRHKSLRSRM